MVHIDSLITTLKVTWLRKSILSLILAKDILLGPSLAPERPCLKVKCTNATINL